MNKSKTQSRRIPWSDYITTSIPQSSRREPGSLLTQSSRSSSISSQIGYACMYLYYSVTTPSHPGPDRGTRPEYRHPLQRSPLFPRDVCFNDNTVVTFQMQRPRSTVSFPSAHVSRTVSLEQWMLRGNVMPHERWCLR